MTPVHWSAEKARNKEKLGCYPDKLVSTRFYQTAEFFSINSTKSPNHPILIRFSDAHKHECDKAKFSWFFQNDKDRTHLKGWAWVWNKINVALSIFHMIGFQIVTVIAMLTNKKISLCCLAGYGYNKD